MVCALIGVQAKIAAKALSTSIAYHIAMCSIAMQSFGCRVQSTIYKHMARRMWHSLICCDMQEGEEVRQKNEGKWWFKLQDSIDGSAVQLDVEIGRYMDTSLVRADVQPSFVRLLIKVWHGRTLQAITCGFTLLNTVILQHDNNSKLA